MVEWWCYLVKFHTLPAIGVTTAHDQSTFDRVKKMCSDYRQKSIHWAFAVKDHMEREWQQVQQTVYTTGV